MKIISISTNGIGKIEAVPVKSKTGNEYFAISHGEEGRGRWQVRMPLAAREFPSPSEHGKNLALVDEYKLVDLKKNDPKGNGLYLIASGDNDGKFLVFWKLSPGYRGGASFEVSGSARVICEGYEADGMAGRMGGASCPVVLVEGPCTLSWTRSGRLYGGDAEWVANYDGEKWIVAPTSACALEDAVMNY